MSNYKDLLTGKTFEDRLYEGGVGGRIFLERPGGPIFDRNAFVIRVPGNIRGDTIHITHINEREGPFKEKPTVRRAYLLICNCPEIDLTNAKKYDKNMRVFDEIEERLSEGSEGDVGNWNDETVPRL